MKIHLEAGQIFGKLTVIKEAEKYRLPSGQTNRAYLCKCDCGNEKVIRLAHLVRGRISTCGCSYERHGLAGKRIYRTWRSMHERCTLDKVKNGHRYKQRGISVCDDWKSFKSFRDWAFKNGYDDTKQIDRIDNNKGYFPENCRFVTNIENVNNREVTFYVDYYGEKKSFTLLMRELKIPETHWAAIRGRIARGWKHTKAILTPIRNGNYKKGKRSVDNK